MSIASAQSNCNIVGVEHKDGYYFLDFTLLSIQFPKEVFIHKRKLILNSRDDF